MLGPISTMTLSRALRKKQVLATLVIVICIIWLLSGPITERLCTSYPSLAGASLCSFDFVNDDWNLYYHLGGNGPWIPKADVLGNVNDPLPDGCAVDQVHMVCWYIPTRRTQRLTSAAVTPRRKVSYEECWKS